MKILELRALRGPNYWSVHRQKLIAMRLDIESLEKRPTNEIEGFPERLEAMFPEMYEHQCSENRDGGFFFRVREGTWIGHVVEHIALEIQKLAGMDVRFGRTRETNVKGVYNVVFSYMEENVGLFAAMVSVDIARKLVDGEAYDIEADIQKMREMRDRERLGPSTGAIVEEAAARGIPYSRLNNSSLVMLGYGVNQKRVQATISSTTSNIAVDIACDKEETKNLLKKANVPIPDGLMVRYEDELEEAINTLKYPIVIKPINGNHGKGATININNWEEALDALDYAQEYSKKVIVEKFIHGHDFRLLVINYKLVAAAKRTPAYVMGDGKLTIQELINIINSDPKRGYGHENILTVITVDGSTYDILDKKGLSLDSVLPEGEILYLKKTANLSTGGTSTDVTDLVHPYNVFLAERIARIIGLDICGIDIMATDIATPINENGGTVLEVNAAPGFRMHVAPTEGLPRNVAAPVIDMLFPPGTEATIPIVAVTGTNGKTTTTRLIAHMMKNIGHKVGYTTTEGIYIQNMMMMEGDCTGPQSAEFVLRDPAVDFAVLECARGGILRAGLGFEKCDIGIVTNVTEDHLGLKDIETLDEMAMVKSVIPETVKREGFAILNADDDRVYNMCRGLECNVALFSLDENNPRIIQHCINGGIAAFTENGYITISKGGWKIRIEKIVNVPLTMSGKASFMVQNILPAVITGFVRSLTVEDIKVALQTFIPSPTTTPGRMNLFQFREYNIMVDYAHNPSSFQAIGKYLEKITEFPKIGIIAAIGDRRDEDIISIGRISAQIFDEIIIRYGKNLRGRTPDEIVELLQSGIYQERPEMKLKIIPGEKESISYAIDNAEKGAFIIVCTEEGQSALEIIRKYKEEEDQKFLIEEDLMVLQEQE
jgi:cyanophycin synthetase